MNDNRGTKPSPPSGVSAKPQGAPAKPPLALEVVALTDVGLVRSHNEDYVGYFVPPDERQQSLKGTLYLAADGMGGHQAGEVASQGAVELVIGEYYGDTAHDIGTSLVRAFRRANQQVYDWAQADSAKAGMGTTLVAAVILGRKVYVANVGDSRAYLIRKSTISQITEDHSWVGEQVKAGLLTPEQARQHPQRNVVTRALGSKPEVDVDLFEGEIDEGDVLVLCSDGLTGHVEDPEIAAIVQQHPPKEAGQLLINQAKERGGSDNIGLVIVSAQQKKAPAAPAPVAVAPKKETKRTFPLIPVMVGVAAVLVLVLASLFAIPRLFQPAPGSETPVAGTGADTVTLQPTVTEALPVEPSTTPAPPEPTSPGTVEQPEATLAPESTLAPTYTPAPVPSPTRRSATTPTRSPGPVATERTSYPAPQLSEPDDNIELSGVRRFSWQWQGPSLDERHAFDLRIWSEEEDRAGAPRRGAVAPTHDTHVDVDLQHAPAIADGGTGSYFWSVVVVETLPGRPPRIVGEWGQKRKFTYSASSGPGPGSKPTTEPEH